MKTAPKLPAHTASNSARTWVPASSTNDGTYLGRYDVTGWHAASARSRVRQPRSTQLPLRLAA